MNTNESYNMSDTFSKRWSRRPHTPKSSQFHMRLHYVCLIFGRVDHMLRNHRNITCVCKSTHRGFRGPNNCFSGAPCIFSQEIKRRFSTPNRSMPMPRSIEVLGNDRKLHCVGFGWNMFTINASRFSLVKIWCDFSISAARQDFLFHAQAQRISSFHTT